mmetsp:Transcript_31722/g.48612  ORF Transcript_31722/g.48612 Transcript_31722/m.48612 type:complete len:202 (-) Transcript_31722:1509-2114(-)
MNSTPPCCKFLTGRTNLAGVEKRKTPGKNFSLGVTVPSSLPEDPYVEIPSSRFSTSVEGMKAISRVLGTEPWSSSILSSFILIPRSVVTNLVAVLGSRWPRRRPSIRTGKKLEGQTFSKVESTGIIPIDFSSLRKAPRWRDMSISSLGMGTQLRLMWFSNPQGEPSGVCTGQTKPQASGSSFLTVVVFISVKYCPLWIERK